MNATDNTLLEKTFLPRQCRKKNKIETYDNLYEKRISAPWTTLSAPTSWICTSHI